jgi:hypothetical protein
MSKRRKQLREERRQSRAIESGVGKARESEASPGGSACEGALVVDGELTEKGREFQALLDQLPKEQRKPFLDEIIARKRIEETMCPTQVEAFQRVMEERKAWITQLTPPERAGLLAEVEKLADELRELNPLDRKAYWRARAYEEMLLDVSEQERPALLQERQAEREALAKMTDVEKAEYWRDEEAFEQTMQDALHTFIEGLDQRLTRPQDNRLDQDEVKRTFNEFFTLIETHGTGRAEAALRLINEIWELVKEHVEPLRSYVKIDRYLRVLLGDKYLSALPVTLQGYIKSRGVDKRFEEMTFREIIEAIFMPEKESWLETVWLTLDMLFEKRYGWPEGTARTMSIPELCLALEHAIEQDDSKRQPPVSDRPSIWDLTRTD